jgi:hypothetical protein
MSSPSFDTHAFIKRLKDAGISETQAEAQTEALTQATEGRLGIRIKEIETSLLKWVIGLLLAQTGVLITAFKLFSH